MTDFVYLLRDDRSGITRRIYIPLTDAQLAAEQADLTRRAQQLNIDVLAERQAVARAQEAKDARASKRNEQRREQQQPVVAAGE